MIKRFRTSDPLPLRARLAPVLLGGGIAVIVVLHALRPDLHPARYYLSEYGNEAWGWLFAGGLALIAFGLLALASALRVQLGARVSPRLMQLAGGMLLLSALFTTDRQLGEVEAGTIAGQLHGLLSIGAFCLLIVAMAALSPRLGGGTERLGRLGELALPLAVAGPAVAAAAFVVAPGVDGLRQRAFLAIVFGWLLATAFQIHAIGQDRREIGRERDRALDEAG